jgi:hypothetical protein
MRDPKGRVSIAAVAIGYLLVSGGRLTAQRTAGTAAIDAALERAVARRDVPGAVAIAADRRGVFYSGIGTVSAHRIKTAQPQLSADFSFVNEGKDKWSLGFLITGEEDFWLDPSRGIAGVILMQFLPFAGDKALALYRDFERAVYETHR